MASKVEVILKLTDKFSKEMKGVGKATKGLKVDLKQLAVAGGIALGTFAAIGVAGKKAFEFGKQGAIVTQTTESFALLLDKVGATPDLLDDLRIASKGTISDLGLMSSTATLLAGASGDLATELAKATPRLLEIAKAANKLNPALGDTAFQYQSIATGIKRASPLILDNLGLIIKVGDANEKMALKLGKTVKALTAEEKSLAILNAALDAGDTLIKQVGGSTDSATDSFAELEVEIENASNTLKERLAQEMGPVIDRFFDMQDGVVNLEEALKDGAITQEAYENTIFAINKGLLTWGEVSRGATQAIERNFEAMDASVGPMADYGLRLLDIASAATDAGTATEDAIEPTTLLGGAVAELGGSYDAAKSAAGLLGSSIKLLTDNMVEAERLKLVLKIATEDLSGAQIEELLTQQDQLENISRLNEAIEDGTVDKEKFLEVTRDGKVSEEELNEIFGETPGFANDAAEAISGVALSSEEAGTQLSIARLKAMGLKSALEELPKDIDITVTTTFVTIGGPSVGVGRFDISPVPDGGRAHGGPVSAGGAFMVGERGPELFVPPTSGNIVPNNKLGGVGGDTFEITQHFYNQDVVALAYDEIWRMRDKRDNLFMGG